MDSTEDKRPITMHYFIHKYAEDLYYRQAESTVAWLESTHNFDRKVFSVLSSVVNGAVPKFFLLLYNHVFISLTLSNIRCIPQGGTYVRLLATRILSATSCKWRLLDCERFSLILSNWFVREAIMQITTILCKWAIPNCRDENSRTTSEIAKREPVFTGN